MENKDKLKEKLPHGVKEHSSEVATVKRPSMVGNKYAVGHGCGRPEEWTQERIEEEAKELEKWFANPKNYYLNAFASERGYASNWYDVMASRSKVFRETLSRAREIQETRIVGNSLERKFDGNFAKFVLANRHGWKEKTEVSGDAANPLSFVLGNIDGNTKDIIDISEGKTDE